jgi:hypothetical protein
MIFFLYLDLSVDLSSKNINNIPPYELYTTHLNCELTSSDDFLYLLCGHVSTKLIKYHLTDENPFSGKSTEEHLPDQVYLYYVTYHVHKETHYLSITSKIYLRNNGSNIILHNNTGIENIQSIAVDNLDNNHIFISGTENFLTEIDGGNGQAENISTYSLFDTFGSGPILKFQNPRGILFHNGILYVCDQNRLLAFVGRTLIRIYEPAIDAYKVAIWKDTIVVAAIHRTYFFNIQSARHLFTAIFSSLSITVTPQYLYIAGSDGIRVF